MCRCIYSSQFGVCIARCRRSLHVHISVESYEKIFFAGMRSRTCMFVGGGGRRCFVVWVRIIPVKVVSGLTGNPHLYIYCRVWEWFSPFRLHALHNFSYTFYTFKNFHPPQKTASMTKILQNAKAQGVGKLTQKTVISSESTPVVIQIMFHLSMHTLGALLKSRFGQVRGGEGGQKQKHARNQWPPLSKHALHTWTAKPETWREKFRNMQKAAAFVPPEKGYQSC